MKLNRTLGKTPMDILHMRLTPYGFELTFTKPVDPASAGDPANVWLSEV